MLLGCRRVAAAEAHALQHLLLQCTAALLPLAQYTHPVGSAWCPNETPCVALPTQPARLAPPVPPDHSVSSLMAQQPEYNLARPPAYAWDLLLLSGMTLLCGLLGLPPVNGVLPQAPMHTRSLAALGSRVARGGGSSTGAAGEAERKGSVEGGGTGVAAGQQQQQGQGRQQQGQLVHRHVRGRAGGSAAEEGLEGGEVRLMVGEAEGSAALAVGSVSSSVAGGSCGGKANGHSHGTFVANVRGPPSRVGQHEPCDAGGVGAGNGQALLQSGAPSDPHEQPQPQPHQRERGQQQGQPQAHAAHVSAAVTLQMHVVEQRLSNLLQSLGVAACLFATPAIRQIPEVRTPPRRPLSSSFVHCTALPLPCRHVSMCLPPPPCQRNSVQRVRQPGVVGVCCSRHQHIASVPLHTTTRATSTHARTPPPPGGAVGLLCLHGRGVVRRQPDGGPRAADGHGPGAQGGAAARPPRPLPGDGALRGHCRLHLAAGARGVPLHHCVCVCAGAEGKVRPLPFSIAAPTEGLCARPLL